MESLSINHVELNDSSTDLFSNVPLKLNTLSATTDNDCNSIGSIDTKQKDLTTWRRVWNNPDSKMQSTKSTTKTHKFRFWLNKTTTKESPENKKSRVPCEASDNKKKSQNITWDYTIHPHGSIGNHQVSSSFFPHDDFNEGDRSLSSQAAICELENEVLNISDVTDDFDRVNHSFSSRTGLYEPENGLHEITGGSDAINNVDIIDANFISKASENDLGKEDRDYKDTDVVQNVAKSLLYNKIIDNEITLEEVEKFTDPFSRPIFDELIDTISQRNITELLEYINEFANEENCNVLDVPQHTTVPHIRSTHSTGTFLESFSDPWLDSDCSYASWEEYEIDCTHASDFHLSFSKRRTRVRLLIHYLKNKLSHRRIDSETQLLNSLWCSILMREKDPYWNPYYYYY